MKYATRVEVDLVIGNEVDRRDVVVYSPQDILGAMQYAKREAPGYPSVAAAGDNLLQRDGIAASKFRMAAGS